MWLAVAGGVVMIVFLIASWSREDPLERIEKEIAALADFNATLRYDQIDKTVRCSHDEHASEDPCIRATGVGRARTKRRPAAA
jgi:hypothetical protein